MAAPKKIAPPVKQVAKKAVATSSIKVSSEARCQPGKATACVCAKTAPAKKAPVAAAPVKATSPATTKNVTFSVRADPGSLVSVAGDFNKWDSAANPLRDPAGTGEFSTVLTLPFGSHEYKFVINGTWCVDPECTEWVQNSLGTLNSVCKV